MKLKNFFSSFMKNSDIDKDARKYGKHVGKDEITSKIVNNLMHIPLLLDYKWIKSRKCFELKTEFGFKRLDIENWSGFDLDRDIGCVTIRPSMYLRHNILHEWFAEFSFKTKSDQRNSWSVGRSLQMLGLQNEIHFLPDLKDYDKDFNKLCLGIEKLNNAIEPYADLKHLFDSDIKKMIDNKNYEFPRTGVEWIFESMILANNYATEDYGILKVRLVNHIEKMYSDNEPNLIEYYDILDQIFEKLEKIKAPNTRYS
jgi:hypothetical protein